jgi:purine-cytosine permease-like protein
MTRKHSIRLGKYRLNLPGSRPVRVLIGVLLILGGCVGFLPVLGFWMVPLGLVVLSIDLPFVRRWRRKVEVWWGKRKARKAAQKAANARWEKERHKEK